MVQKKNKTPLEAFKEVYDRVRKALLEAADKKEGYNTSYVRVWHSWAPVGDTIERCALSEDDFDREYNYLKRASAILDIVIQEKRAIEAVGGIVPVTVTSTKLDVGAALSVDFKPGHGFLISTNIQKSLYVLYAFGSTRTFWQKLLLRPPTDMQVLRSMHEFVNNSYLELRDEMIKLGMKKGICLNCARCKTEGATTKYLVCTITGEPTDIAATCDSFEYKGGFDD